MAVTLFLNNSKELDLLLGHLHLPPKLIEISKKRRYGKLANPGPAFQNGDTLTSGILSTSKALVNFVSNASPGAKLLLGVSEYDKAQIIQWVQYYETHLKPAADDHQAMLNRAEELNDHLCSRTFIIGNYLSIADLFLFQCIHPFMTNLSFQDKEKLIHLSRWFNHMQNTVRATHRLPFVQFHKSKLYV